MRLSDVAPIVHTAHLVLWQFPLLPSKFLLANRYLNLPTRKPYCKRKHCLHILYRNEICAILFHCCLILVVMATPLAPSKIQVTYLNSTTTYTLLYVRKILWFLARNWILCNFGIFLPKFGCNDNSFNSLENSDSKFEFTKPVKLY